MECRPLTDQLRIRTRIDQFIVRDAGELIRRSVANAISGCLDGVHFHAGQVGQDIGNVFQRRPVVLNVLARGEMAIVAVVLVRDVGEHAQLARGKLAVGNGHPQHVGVKLQIETVHQPQGLELVLGQLASETAAHLMAELRRPVGDHVLVQRVIGIHRKGLTCA